MIEVKLMKRLLFSICIKNALLKKSYVNKNLQGFENLEDLVVCCHYWYSYYKKSFVRLNIL